MKQAIFKNTVMVCHSSWETEKILFWYEYHKQFVPNVKIVQAIPPESRRTPYSHKDFQSISMDPKIWFQVVDLFWSRWLDSEYDNFVFMEHDAFIVRPFLAEAFLYMKRRGLHCLFPPIQTKHEHRKDAMRPILAKKWGARIEDMVWCLPNCVLMTRAGLEMYYKGCIPFVHSEMMLPNLFLHHKNGAENPWIYREQNRSGVLQQYELIDAKSRSESCVLHSIKDYNNIVNHFGWTNGTSKEVLGSL